MFEREITDAFFVPRWSIVRVNRQQSIAEHSWAVGIYANDIALYLGLNDKLCLGVNRHALWHDSRDEIFSGDLPGPNKRALLRGHRGNFDAQLNTWADKVFPALPLREGSMNNDRDNEIVHLVVKAADWFEAAVYMATEFQMGNKCTERHIAPNLAGAISTVDKIKEHAKGPPSHLFEELVAMMVKGIDAAMNGQSEGPWITREDESR